MKYEDAIEMINAGNSKTCTWGMGCPGCGEQIFAASLLPSLFHGPDDAISFIGWLIIANKEQIDAHQAICMGDEPMIFDCGATPDDFGDEEDENDLVS